MRNDYSLKEAEEIFNVSRRTLYRWIDEGKIKAVKLGGRWRIPAEEVREIRAKGTQSRSITETLKVYKRLYEIEDPREWAEYLYKEGDVTRSTEGLEVEIPPCAVTVYISYEDIAEYLKLDTVDPDEIADAYDEHKEEIAIHFIARQREDILNQLSEQLED